jgi:predicted nucleic-acid-binding protein
MKKFTLDTNVLVRLAVLDDAKQARVAAAVIRSADLLAIPLPVLCEFVWVLGRGYRKSPAEIASAIRRLLNSNKVTLNRPAVDAGLAILEAGGDFADGAAAYEGQWLGGSEFVTFDRKAATLLPKHGYPTRLLEV